MAKKRKRKNSKGAQLSGFQAARPFLDSALRAANSPIGRVLLAEALIVAAGVLTRKHPVATVAAAGAEATSATKAVVGSASQVAVSLMQAAADRLRSGSHRRTSGARGDSEPTGRNGGAWDQLDRGAIRQAIMGEFSRMKKGKKAKAAGRH